jgi:low temperature requirement protein LtrA
MHLGAEVNWHELFHDLIDDFSIDKLAERQRAAAETTGLPASLITPAA